MSDEHVKAFLKAEQQAVELVATLEMLKQEVESYRDAGEALATSSESLYSCSAKLAGLASEAEQVLSALNDFGTPAILDGIQATKRHLQEISVHLAAVRTDMAGVVSTLAVFVAESNQASKRLHRLVGAAVVCFTVTLVGCLVASAILLFGR